MAAKADGRAHDICCSQELLVCTSQSRGSGAVGKKKTLRALQDRHTQHTESQPTTYGTRLMDRYRGNVREKVFLAALSTFATGDLVWGVEDSCADLQASSADEVNKGAQASCMTVKAWH